VIFTPGGASISVSAEAVPKKAASYPRATLSHGLRAGLRRGGSASFLYRSGGVPETLRSEAKAGAANTIPRLTVASFAIPI
jgi:hypothetical protein